MNKICVVGMGPGGQDYLLPISRKKIEQADVLIGAKRCFDLVDEQNKEIVILQSHYEAMIDYIKKNRICKKIVILVTGDTGFYSLLRFLKNHFNIDELEVHTGISSMQYMFAAICELWDDACIQSLHGKDVNFIDLVKKHQKVGLLTDKKWTPIKIAEELLKYNVLNKLIYVGENLTYENEKISKFSISELAKETRPFNMCVVVIMNE